jgi:O-antigen ligase
VEVFSVAVAFAPQGYTDRLSSTTDFSKDDGSAAARWDTTKAGFWQTLQYPFGVGLGMNGLLNQEEGRGWSAGVHNVYLEISTELGIIPLIIYMVLLFKLIGSMSSMRLTIGERSNSILSAAIGCSLIGFAVDGFFSPVAFHFYFYIIAGIAVAAKEILRVPSTSSQPIVQTISPRVALYQSAR